MKRRHLLQTLSTGPLVATSLAAQAPAPAQPTPAAQPPGIIDCNVWLGQHPCRSLPWHDTATIKTKLRERGVAQAWASSFDLILHRDLTATNAWLAKQCAASQDLLLPVGAINPMLPGWQSDLIRCAHEHSMKLIRLLPSYHGYSLEQPVFTELLRLATEHGLLVQITAQIEDERTQHPLLRAAPADLKPLPRDAPVMVLNATSTQVLTALRGSQAILDTSLIEGVAGLSNLLRDWPLEQLVFGSHAPWFYWEANALKLLESDLTQPQLTAIKHGNAQRLLQ